MPHGHHFLITYLGTDPSCRCHSLAQWLHLLPIAAVHAQQTSSKACSGRTPRYLIVQNQGALSCVAWPIIAQFLAVRHLVCFVSVAPRT